jgi:hypothetical protein
MADTVVLDKELCPMLSFCSGGRIGGAFFARLVLIR